jgi:hypothetical protein
MLSEQPASWKKPLILEQVLIFPKKEILPIKRVIRGITFSIDEKIRRIA